MTTAKTTRPAKSRRTAEVVEAPREADLEAAGGVTAVTRALQLLDTFGMHDERLTLAELTRRSGMHKTTALRLLRTLALAGYVVQRDDGEWRLGPAAGWLGARYQSSFDANNVVEPMLLALSQATGESAAFSMCAKAIREPASHGWRGRNPFATMRAWARCFRWTWVPRGG